MGFLEQYEKQFKIFGAIMIPILIASFFIFYNRYVDSKFGPCKDNCGQPVYPESNDPFDAITN